MRLDIKTNLLMNNHVSIVFVTNFASLHTIPLAEEIALQCDGDFLYIETKELSEERRNLGYDRLSTRPYIVNYRSFSQRSVYYKEIINNAETVIASYGSIDNSLLQKRLRADKCTLLMAERLFKKGILKLLDPKFWKTLLFIKKFKRNKRLGLLCMGAYVAGDFSLCGFPHEKMYKFGYITNPINIDETTKPRKDYLDILWVGRLIWWKQPFDAIKAVEKIANKGYRIRFKMVGAGKLSEAVQKAIRKTGLSEIEFVGKLSNSEVQLLMYKSDILLCTSNRLEGWGAVINEGMSMGCTVVANKEMGATNYLIKHGLTGFVYKGGWRNLASAIETAVKSDLKTISCHAQREINDNWNSHEAAKRVCSLIKSLKNNLETLSYGAGELCNKA